MSLGISSSDFTQTLTNIGASVTYRAFDGTRDEFGGISYAWATDVSKTWIFFKRSSRTDLVKWGVVEIGDAYVLMPSTDSISHGDRIVFNGEIFEYTPECIWSERKAGGTTLYKYYSMLKVGEE